LPGKVGSFSLVKCLLGTQKDIRVATFHVVDRGQIQLKLDNNDNYVVDQGEVIVWFSGLRAYPLSGK